MDENTGLSDQPELASLLVADPIIVYGAPRSGTTYLEALLNSHPQIFITHETRIYVWVHRALNELTNSREAILDRKEDFKSYLREQMPALVRRFYERLVPRRVLYWGDKNPHYAGKENEGCLDTILVLHPSAKFIHIIRDGRDVVASLVRKVNPEGRHWTTFAEAHAIWLEHVKLGCEFGSRIPSDQYLQLRYEGLVNDDIGTVRKIFEFLGIDLVGSVLQFCEQQSIARTPYSGPTRTIESGQFLASDWSRVFASEERRQSLALLSETLVELGYESAAFLLSEP